MQVSQLTIDNFRGIRNAALQFSGHTLLIGGNDVGKCTICEALGRRERIAPDRAERRATVRPSGPQRGVHHDLNTAAGSW